MTSMVKAGMVALALLGLVGCGAPVDERGAGEESAAVTESAATPAVATCQQLAGQCTTGFICSKRHGSPSPSTPGCPTSGPSGPLLCCLN